MREYLNRLPKEIQDLIHLAGDIAFRKNMPAYLVGGFVRDLILGVRNFDLDIVVEGDGISFAEEFARILKSKLIRHRRFGTATIMHKPHLKIDIASARKEFYPAPAHLPVVENSSLKDDHFRRDFTINAMAISITVENFGKLIDPFGGEGDLRNKEIRILHSSSFIDDPTRILRAVRFEQRYNFRIEPETLKSLKEAVKLKMLEKVEPQRIRDELMLVLKEEQPLKEIRRIQELAGFGFIKPRLKAFTRTYGLLSRIERQVGWFKKEYSQRKQLDAWVIYFTGLIDSLSINEVKSICRKFAFRKGEEKRILAYKEIKNRFILRLSRKEIKPSEIFSLLSPLSYEAIILIKAKYKNRQIQRHIEDFFRIYNDMRICICGDDLHRLGVMPGPAYQKIFAKVLDAKLNGLVRTDEEELALIKRLVQ